MRVLKKKKKERCQIKKKESVFIYTSGDFLKKLHVLIIL